MHRVYKLLKQEIKKLPAREWDDFDIISTFSASVCRDPPTSQDSKHSLMRCQFPKVLYQFVEHVGVVGTILAAGTLGAGNYM